MFDFTRYESFGWIVHQKRMAVGESFIVNIPEGYLPETASNVTLWSKGRVESGLTGKAMLPGDCSASIPRTSGSHTMLAVEDSEFWCINYSANRHRLPIVEVLDATDSVTLEFDTLVCTGDFFVDGVERSAPLSVSAGKTIEPNGRVLGLSFKGER